MSFRLDKNSVDLSLRFDKVDFDLSSRFGIARTVLICRPGLMCFVSSY